MGNVFMIFNELTVEIYDSQTYQRLAVIDCVDIQTADSIYTVLQNAKLAGKITGVFDN